MFKYDKLVAACHSDGVEGALHFLEDAVANRMPRWLAIKAADKLFRNNEVDVNGHGILVHHLRNKKRKAT